MKVRGNDVPRSSANLLNMYCSPDLVGVIKSVRMGHVTCVSEMRNAYKSVTGHPDGKDHTWKIYAYWGIKLE
jgi:hypothetical protein